MVCPARALFTTETRYTVCFICFQNRFLTFGSSQTRLCMEVQFSRIFLLTKADLILSNTYAQIHHHTLQLNVGPSPLTSLLLLHFLLPLAGINWSRTSGGITVEEIANISGPKTTLMFQEPYILTSLVKHALLSCLQA